MARGFESKMVEFQQEEAQRKRSNSPSLSAEQQAAAARRASLELARRRAAADLDRATAPAHRQMLQHAIEALDQQLRDLR